MKMLLVFAMGFALSWNLKGNMSITPDNQVDLGSDDHGGPGGRAELSRLHHGHDAADEQFAGAGARPAAAYGRPAVAAFPATPVVTSGANTYAADAPATAPGGNPFGAATKALRGQYSRRPGHAGRPRGISARPVGFGPRTRAVDLAAGGLPDISPGVAPRAA